MNERNLYRGLNDFEGSIDEEGNLYDECHRLVGRIEGNDVYDYCNIKQGTMSLCPLETYSEQLFMFCFPF